MALIDCFKLSKYKIPANVNVRWYAFLLLALLASASPFLNAQDDKTQTLIIATDHLAPYSYVEDSTVKGLYVDMMNKLVDTLPLTIDYVFCPWVRCLKMVEEGKADILVGLSKTQEREKQYSFLNTPFFSSHKPFFFYYIKDEHAIENEQQLSQRIIGKLRGSAHYPEFDQDESLTTVESVNVPSLIHLLKMDRIDVFIHLGGTIDPFLNKVDTLHQINKSPYVKDTYQQGYIVMSNKWRNSKLANKLNSSLSEVVTSGFIDALFVKYGIDI